MPLWLAKLLSQNQQKRFDTKSSQFNINDQFEYIGSRYWFNDQHPEVPTYVTILDKFAHHYSYETMYYIRIEQIGCHGGSLVKYTTISEKDLRELQEEINKWVKIAVSAAEQIFTGAGSGKEKKEYVINWLKEHKVKYDSSKIDAMIEDAVYELKQSALIIGEVENTVHTNSEG